jgi:hypothetical protein
VLLGAIGMTLRVASTNQLTQFIEPMAGPNEFDSKNSQSDRYNDERGTGRHYHDDTQQQDAAADNADDNTATGCIGEMYCPSDHAGRASTVIVNDQMQVQESKRSSPGIFGGCGVIVSAGWVCERMPNTRIYMNLVVLAQSGK